MSDSDSIERSLEVLRDLFGSVASEETIQAVVKGYNGCLTPSIEALMKLTNSNQFEMDGYTVRVDPTTLPAPKTSNEFSGNAGETLSFSAMSYRAAFNSSKPKESRDCKPGTQVKPPEDILNIYSNKKDVQRIVNNINKGFRVLILMRGLPGSGKSTLSKNIIKLTINQTRGHIFSSDDYFIRNGVYVYERDKISHAHDWNHARVATALCRGVSPVIVDNTNTELWEMHHYVTNAVRNGYIVEVVEPRTPWVNKFGELSRKSVHGVPVEKIKKMNSKFQQSISGKSLLGHFKLQYPNGMQPPKNRLIPKFEKQVDPTADAGASVLQFNGNPCQVFNSNLHERQLCEGSNGQKRRTETNRFTISDTAASTSTEYKFFDSPGHLSKPQRSHSGSQRNGLLKNYSDMTEWRPLDDWGDVVASETAPEPVANLCKDMSTQTVHETAEDLNSYKQLIPVNRSINLHTFGVNSPANNVTKKLRLDKGVMTDEDIDSLSDSLSNIEKIHELRSMFQHVPIAYIRDIFEKCKGDVNWACNILLEANIDENSMFANPDQEETEEQADQMQHTEWDDDVEIIQVGSMEYTGNAEMLPLEENGEAINKEKVIQKISELKRQIEENFTISDDHYSDHVVKLRKKIHGEKINEFGIVEPSASDLPNASYELAEPYKNTSLSEESQVSTTGEAESDVESETVDLETVSVRVGNDFIGELNRIYNTSYYDSTLEPVINIPATLLNQIHALWIESVCNQIDVQRDHMNAVIQEDEEFARKLVAQEEEEERQGHQPEIPSLEDIMQMEVDLARYNTAHSEWENESPDDWATKLSKQKLIKLFPDLNESLLVEVLHAYGYNFASAFEDLLVSTGMVSRSQTNEIDREEVNRILAKQEKELIERALQEKEKQLEVPTHLGPSTSGATSEDPKAIVDSYRLEAKDLMVERDKHHNKAQEYMGRKMYGVANYYSNLANLYTKKHDYINSLAASEIVQINTRDNNTLDLHCFYVKEALQVLDMYLDLNIRTLRERNKKPYSVKLFLITGRGVHSPGRTARIKPAVKRRLTERNIKYFQENPGLLSIIVSAQDTLTDCLI